MHLFLRSTFLAALGCLAATSGLCEDFLSSGASARSAGAAGVYLSSSDSPLDAMSLNPAGLALLGGPTLEVSLAAGFARGRFENRANPNGRLNANGIVPYGAFGMPVGKRLSIGIAALPELMSAARWNYMDTPGGAGGVSYGALQHRSEILAMRMAAGFGVYVSPKLQLGATMGAVYNENTLETAYVFQNHPALAGLKTLLDLRTSGAGWNGTAGALVSPSKKLQFGVVYRSRTTIASRGNATGNAGLQFEKLGLGAARPDFRYDARVDNVLPQSIAGQFTWSVSRRMRLAGQTEWVNWRRAFVELPVTLTNGDNADINGLLGTNGINDSIPLRWRNQVVSRLGFERLWLERTAVRAGYSYSTQIVPDTTLSPLTAAIGRNTFSAGIGYTRGRARLDAAYVIDPAVERSTGTSSLKASEYSGSRIRVATQGLLLTTSFRL